MSAHAWSSLRTLLEPSLDALRSLAASDEQLSAFIDTENHDSIQFSWASAGSDDGILCSVSHGKVLFSAGSVSEAAFVLSALPQQWQNVYSVRPEPPYQSYWGLFGQNIHQDGAEIRGDMQLFLRLAPIWRRVLDLSRTAYCGGEIEEEPHAALEEDHLKGSYVYLDLPTWGRTKVFYEQSGNPDSQPIIFLHTAGSDGRQYHGVMNHPDMLRRCFMTVFDMPGHGRSFPGEKQIPGRHTNNENAYIAVIAAVIRALGLKKPIVCGASMAGHVSLAVALRNDEVGAGAVIPCQACDFTDMPRNYWSRSLSVNQSLFTPEYIYGMMSPFSPLKDRNLVWHSYSAQAFSMYHGDLDFYFGGWDGRGRVEKIDTKKCPVYMLTGDYDWSTTPAMSKATADKIAGATFVTMDKLGHFPATEHPTKFVSYLIPAIDAVTKQMRSET